MNGSCEKANKARKAWLPFCFTAGLHCSSTAHPSSCPCTTRYTWYDSWCTVAPNLPKHQLCSSGSRDTACCSTITVCYCSRHHVLAVAKQVVYQVTRPLVYNRTNITNANEWQPPLVRTSTPTASSQRSTLVPRPSLIASSTIPSQQRRCDLGKPNSVPTL